MFNTKILINKKNMTDEKNKREWREEFEVSGDKLKDKIKELIKEGNVRRVIIKNQQDETIMEIPVTVAVVGTLLAPMLAAIGALATFLTSCKVVVERREPVSPDSPPREKGKGRS